jgi:long-chain acyl-CoA synthetase
VADPEWGEQVTAVVQLVAGQVAGAVLERSLLDHCAGRLARFKLPRSIEFTDDLPRTSAGKLYKRRLQEEHRHRVSAAED